MTHYLEVHITIEPVFEENLERLKVLAAKFNFKVASLLMKKREQDLPTMSMFDSFMTGHFRPDENEKAFTVIKELVISIQQAGFKVYRYKLETVPLDSRYADTLQLLG